MAELVKKHYTYIDSIWLANFSSTTFFFSFCVPVSSPPGTEKSVSRMTYFCTHCARDAEPSLLYWSMPAWMAAATSGSAFASARVVAVEPRFLRAIRQLGSSLSLGSSVTGSTMTRSVSRMERYLRLSPIRTARRDDQLLDASGDRQQLLAWLARRVGERPEVARAQVALLVKRLGRLVWLVEVAHHDVAPAEADLALALLGALAQVELHTAGAQLGADKAELDVAGEGGDRHDAGRFGHAKAFEDGQVEAPKELEHFLADGCRARAQQEGAVQPEGLTNLPEHQHAIDGIHDAPIARRLAARLRERHVAREAARLGRDANLLLGIRILGRDGSNTVHHLLPHARHRKEEGGARLLQQRLQAAREGVGRRKVDLAAGRAVEHH